MKRSKSLSAIALASLFAPIARGQVAEDQRGFRPGEAQSLIHEAQKLTGPYAIQELIPVEIGGIKQWISIRGSDRRNPILLFIHGGAGESEMPSAWLYERPWEDYFTVVQWDQRGAGKTGSAKELQSQAATMSIPRAVSDGEEMVAYLRKTYNRRKIFVLGHSWGSVIGLSIARDHPEWLHAYIGMGQMINWTDNERASYAWVIAQARARNNTQAIKELTSIAPYPEPDGSTVSWKTGIERKWTMRFGSVAWGRSDFNWLQNALQLSPEYTEADLAVRDEQDKVAGKQLYFGSVNFDGVKKLGCPIFLLDGRHDAQTPGEVSFRWFSKLAAPQKEYVWFTDASHELQNEVPGKLLVLLATQVRSLAVAAGDTAPNDEEVLR